MKYSLKCCLCGWPLVYDSPTKKHKRYRKKKYFKIMNKNKLRCKNCSKTGKFENYVDIIIKRLTKEQKDIFKKYIKRM